MCVSFCHRRNHLYWNHEDCDGTWCEFAEGQHSSCQTCRHFRENKCALTNSAALPAAGGCCHHNVIPLSGARPVTPELISLLGIGSREKVAEALDSRNVCYRQGPDGRIFVDPDDLPLPFVYGQGTEHDVADDFDWSGWFEQWNG